MTAAVFGGLASRASGGSFEDGAMTAVSVFLYNDLAGRECGGRPCVKRGSSKSIWKQLTAWHFEGRHALNGQHPSYYEVINPRNGWTKLSRDQSMLHDNGYGKPELKYIYSDGREAVFTADITGNYIPYTDSKYMATYNYVNPVPLTPTTYYTGEYMRNTIIGHGVLDVFPFGLGGNVRGEN